MQHLRRMFLSIFCLFFVSLILKIIMSFSLWVFRKSYQFGILHLISSFLLLILKWFRECFLCGISSYNISDDGTTKWTLATANATPLFDGAIVAHAHMAAAIKHRIDLIFIANGALSSS